MEGVQKSLEGGGGGGAKSFTLSWAGGGGGEQKRFWTCNFTLSYSSLPEGLIVRIFIS